MSRVDDFVGELGGELRHVRVLLSTAPSILQCLQPHLLSYFIFYIHQLNISNMARPSATTEESETLLGNLMPLHHQMDALWTRYLTLLDEYVSAQAMIKRQMASGFLSLAQANFKSPTRRYGQDYYDDRAVASARVRVTETDHGTQMAIVKHTLSETVDDARNKVSDHDNNEALKIVSTQLPSPSPTPEPKRSESPDEKHDEKHGDGALDAPKINTDSIAQPVSCEPSAYDPIRWFGILVPPPLRAAQKSFSASVQDDGGVVQAANSARELRDTEAQIRKLRKLIKKAERGVLLDQHVQD